MLPQSIFSLPQELEAAIKEILKQDARYVLSEVRCRHREPLVVPVRVIRQERILASGFSRNISKSGICLITPQPLPVEEIVQLEIYRLQEKALTIFSKARWCRAYGPEYFMSGCRFLAIEH